MSNTITGSIFGQIIDRVVSASQNDFEESGVDQQTLQEMREPADRMVELRGCVVFSTLLAPGCRRARDGRKSGVGWAGRSRRTLRRSGGEGGAATLYLPAFRLFYTSFRPRSTCANLISASAPRDCITSIFSLHFTVATRANLLQIWQKKLSALHVAQMPWDPAPPPPMQISNPPTVPSNDSKNMQQQMQPPASQPAPYSQNAQPNPRVKQEPGYPPSMQNYQMNGYGAMNGTNIAQQRAAQLLQQNFGDQANASIASAYPQNNVGLPGQQQRPMNLQMPPNRQQQAQHPAQHSPQQQQQQGPPSQQNPQQHQNSVYAAQTDGAGDADLADWQALVASRRAEAAADSSAMHAADGMLRAQFEQRMDVIESGLMQPLENLPSAKGKKRGTAPSSRAATSSIPQLDGELGLEDEAKPEENDDEAINSDLDDSDEEQIQGEEEDGPQGDTMICTYDKVQRVKNKWKCTLKDGILSTGGKDYLFHKAQGEFEW
ncbi:transcription factor IIA, alpha/beta subunit-domain-containing protein [Phyllosticta capitalensis]